MQNYKKNIYFCTNYESKYGKTLIILSFSYFIETLSAIMLPYHRHLDSLFHERARHATKQYLTNRQVDSLYHVRPNNHGDRL